MKKKRQNLDESHAKKWLEFQGYNDICRPSVEPPDFVVEGRYAVEVRRLNRPDDQQRIPLERAIENLLSKFGRTADGLTIGVSCSYRYPGLLPDTQEVNEQVWTALRCVEARGPENWAEVLHCELECGIRLYFHPPIKSPPCCNMFELHGARVGPPQWGSPIELAEMIGLCIEEKSAKVRNKNRVHCYPHWWLLLVDYLLYVQAPNEAQLKMIRDALPSKQFWSKIIVISTENLGWFYKL